MAGKAYEHETMSPGPAVVALLVSMGIPAVLIVWGIAALGTGAINWLSAIVWGLVGTVAFTLFGMMGQRIGMTDMDIVDLLGSTVAEPGSGQAKRIGAVIHHMNGAILAIAWAYGAALVGVGATWISGLWWGVILTVLALIMLSGIGAFHPAVQQGKMRDPGLAAMNFGKMTPMGSLMGHVVYGVILGLGYQFLVIG